MRILFKLYILWLEIIKKLKRLKNQCYISYSATEGYSHIVCCINNFRVN